MSDVTLRPVQPTDLPIFFQHQLDPDANWMAAFTRKDPTDEAAFYTHWAKIQADAGILNRTILADGQVAGHIASFDWSGELELTYWLGREFWGRRIGDGGVAPLPGRAAQPARYAARAASDNLGSRRVLEKCGFRLGRHRPRLRQRPRRHHRGDHLPSGERSDLLPQISHGLDTDFWVSHSN